MGYRLLSKGERALYRIDRTVNKDDDGMDSAASEDDPNHLWCICQKPHNNRKDSELKILHRKEGSLCLSTCTNNILEELPEDAIYIRYVSDQEMKPKHI